jgi:steroid 5-alpha reductase family enzyme
MPASPGLILLMTLLPAIVMFTIMWRIHVDIGDASVIDYYWGPGFVVIAAIAAAACAPLTLLQAILVVAVVVWAARLTWAVVRRHRRANVEDGRYRRLRDGGGPAFWWQSLFSVFLLQAVLQWLIATPIVIAIALPQRATDTLMVAAGFGLFAIGLAIEAIADAQLARHRADPARAGTTLDTGMWGWSRHPNYFGEVLLWWGLSLVAFALSGSLWAFAGPAILTVVVLAVSLRLTEDHMAATRADFARYRARTSAFVPWPPAASGKLPR